MQAQEPPQQEPAPPDPIQQRLIDFLSKHLEWTRERDVGGVENESEVRFYEQGIRDANNGDNRRAQLLLAYNLYLYLLDETDRADFRLLEHGIRDTRILRDALAQRDGEPVFTREQIDGEGVARGGQQRENIWDALDALDEGNMQPLLEVRKEMEKQTGFSAARAMRADLDFDIAHRIRKGNTSMIRGMNKLIAENEIPPLLDSSANRN